MASKKILIIDDDESFLSFLKDFFETRGFDVIAATNAVEAGIELASKLPGLILLDIKMPGIDGLQAYAAIKRNPATKDIPIIVISGLSDKEYKKKALEMGAAEYFAKPLDMEKLIKTVNGILNVA